MEKPTFATVYVESYEICMDVKLPFPGPSCLVFITTKSGLVYMAFNYKHWSNRTVRKGRVNKTKIKVSLAAIFQDFNSTLLVITGNFLSGKTWDYK